MDKVIWTLIFFVLNKWFYILFWTIISFSKSIFSTEFTPNVFLEFLFLINKNINIIIIIIRIPIIALRITIIIFFVLFDSGSGGVGSIFSSGSIISSEQISILHLLLL